MKTVEYGQEHAEVILLLHGGGLSWWNYREAAERLQKRYHVVIPLLDGHAGSDRDFTAIENAAQELIAYIDKAHHGKVTLIGGLSLGGQILIEMLCQRKDICQYALIESALILPMKLTHALIKPMMELSFGLICQPWFAKLQFQSLRLKKELFDDYFTATCGITKANMTAFLKANASYALKPELARTQAKVFLFVGGCEPVRMIRSARLLHRTLPGSVLTLMKHRHHGAFSINHPAEYADQVLKIIQSK